MGIYFFDKNKDGYLFLAKQVASVASFARSGDYLVLLFNNWQFPPFQIPPQRQTVSSSRIHASPLRG
jgi:hypothetical protein